MSKAISFTCSDTTVDKLTGVLKQLQEVSSNGQRRVIRIGGDEKIFDGSIDEISDIMVDGILNTAPYVPSIPSRKQPASDINNPNLVVDSNSDSIVVDDGLTDDNLDIVEEVVIEMVDSRRCFTAFDVTKEAKARGAKQRHKVLKDAVHNMFLNNTMPGYSRELIAIDGVRINPFVYIPDGEDVDSYFANSTVNGHAVNA